MNLRTHNRLPDKEDWKTLLQWLKQGRVTNEGEKGEEMWSNGYCQYTAIYFHIDQTHEGTPEELEKANEPFLQRKRESRAAKRAEGRKLMKQAMKLPAVPCNNPSGIVVFDTETTGFQAGEDEILQFSAIDGDGNVLLNTYVRPYVKQEWSAAAKVHGISPKMVENAPVAHELIPTVRGIFESAKLLISYNGDFDIRFLTEWGIDLSEKPHFDVMMEFAPIYGEWSDWHQDYKWQKLATCAAYYGYEFKAHDSLEDVRATLFGYRKMAEAKQDEQEVQEA